MTGYIKEIEGRITTKNYVEGRDKWNSGIRVKRESSGVKYLTEDHNKGNSVTDDHNNRCTARDHMDRGPRQTSLHENPNNEDFKNKNHTTKRFCTAEDHNNNFSNGRSKDIGNKPKKQNF